MSEDKTSLTGPQTYAYIEQANQTKRYKKVKGID